MAWLTRIKKESMLFIKAFKCSADLQCFCGGGGGGEFWFASSLKLPRQLFALNGNPNQGLFSHYVFLPISSCRLGLQATIISDI